MSGPEDTFTGDWKDFIPNAHDELGIIQWKINGLIHVFEIQGQLPHATEESNILKSSTVIKSAIFEDHLEELLQDKQGNWYRHAGGGRGFYWTQRLALIETRLPDHVKLVKVTAMVPIEITWLPEDFECKHDWQDFLKKMTDPNYAKETFLDNALDLAKNIVERELPKAKVSTVFVEG